MRKRAALLLAIGVLLWTGGCGATRRRGPSLAEPGTNGSLSTVRIQPTPGTTFIPRSTTFRLSWTDENPPPATFAAALRRYKEERGDEPRTIETQATELIREGDSFSWILRRTDGFDLDRGGVYYLELTGNGESVLVTYLVSNER